MYIKNLKIYNSIEMIRDIDFKLGLNLIIDQTPIVNDKATGNNVGKTTVLKLIDFCLGASPSVIYSDTENSKEVYGLVKDFLVDNEIIIELTLTDDFNEPNKNTIVIQRNFLTRKKSIRRINGRQIKEQDFENELLKLIIPQQKAEKPTFRQIISHNIRYKDQSINNTLKILNHYTTDVEYESLYLFLLGCSFDGGAKKQALLAKVRQEEVFKDRLEKRGTKNKFEIALKMVQEEIDLLDYKKSTFNLNEDFEKDLEELNLIKYNINKSSSNISKLKIRKSLIEEAQYEMKRNISTIDTKQLQQLYSEAIVNVEGIQKTFDDLVQYHNKMIVEKTKFIASDLPNLIEKIKVEEFELNQLVEQERLATEKVSKGDSFEELEKVVIELNNKYRLKGEYENILSQFNEVDKNINILDEEIKKIDEGLFSSDFEEIINQKIDKFNKHFSAISDELYGEKYALTFNKKFNKNQRQVYDFSSFNANMSSGKKQGEILCFDLAYTIFADEEEIDCLHFLLNDKKELLHGNQLLKVSEFVKKNDIQLVVSILKDKLPQTVIDKAHIAVELSQENKLFNIEHYM